MLVLIGNPIGVVIIVLAFMDLIPIFWEYVGCFVVFACMIGDIFVNPQPTIALPSTFTAIILWLLLLNDLFDSGGGPIIGGGIMIAIGIFVLKYALQNKLVFWTIMGLCCTLLGTFCTTVKD